MVASQIAREPLVMKICREAFYERATVSVKPTKQVSLTREHWQTEVERLSTADLLKVACVVKSS